MERLNYIWLIIILFTPYLSPIKAQCNETITVEGKAFDMIFVKGGTFQMGATPEQKEDAYKDEFPAHSVTVSDFYIGKYEVTVEQFALFIESADYITDADKKGGSDVWDKTLWTFSLKANWRCDISGKPRKKSEYNHPVIHISWNDAVAYCEWLSKKTHRKFTLPTEAQWEYAALGGKKSQGYKYSGSNNADEVAFHHSNNGVGTQPVGSKKPNELGIYDMSGNVWEWCYDRERKYTSQSQKDPQGETNGSYRSRRGGSWLSQTYCSRVSDRNNSRSDRASSYVGFRIALVVKKKTLTQP